MGRPALVPQSAGTGTSALSSLSPRPKPRWTGQKPTRQPSLKLCATREKTIGPSRQAVRGENCCRTTALSSCHLKKLTYAVSGRNCVCLSASLQRVSGSRPPPSANRSRAAVSGMAPARMLLTIIAGSPKPSAQRWQQPNRRSKYNAASNHPARGVWHPLRITFRRRKSARSRCRHRRRPAGCHPWPGQGRRAFP